MALTDEERPTVVEWVRSYPAGIDSRCWGHGPLEKSGTGEDEVIPDPEDVEPDACREYG